jgi:hypothetical protein
MLPREGYGDAVFTRHDDGTITCDHADPRIRISDVLLHQIASGETLHTSLVLADGSPAHGKPAHPQDLFGAVLTMDCANRRLIYRITGWEPIWLEGDEWCGSYLAEWPD